MKPKANKIFFIEKTNYIPEKPYEIALRYVSTPKNAFATREEAQAVLDEWDRVKKYKACIVALEAENVELKRGLLKNI